MRKETVKETEEKEIYFVSLCLWVLKRNFNLKGYIIILIL